MDRADKIVTEFQTKYKEGFSFEEINEITETHKDIIDMKKFDNAMMGHTCPMVDGVCLWYKHDVYRALRYAIGDSYMSMWD